MTLPRLAFALLALPLLAACDSNQQSAPPAAEAPAAAPAPRAAPAPAAATPAEMAPLFGIFAADLSWCDGGGEGDGSPVTISATRFEGRENICDITALTDNGGGSFAADLVCTAEGQTVEERLELVPIFAPTGEGVTVTYLDRGDERTTLLRCN